MNTPSVQRQPFYRLVLVCLMPACILALLLLVTQPITFMSNLTSPASGA